MRVIPLFASLTVALAGCEKAAPDCGDPIGTFSTTYEVVDAATGGPWFATPGRLPADSVRLLGSDGRLLAQGERRGDQLRLGPAALPLETGAQTCSLRFGQHDAAPLMVHLTPSADPVPQGPCFAQRTITQVDFVFNNAPVGSYYAAVSADSLDGYWLRKVVRLPK